MSTGLMFYLVEVISTLRIALIVFSAIGFVVALIHILTPDFTKLDSETKKEILERERKRTSDNSVKILFISIIILIMTFVLLPSEKQMYAMMGFGNTIDYLKQNDASKNIPPQYLRYIDEYIKERQNEH